MSFRPMLSAQCSSIENLKFPALVSPKLNGIRCVIRHSKALSRTLKAIPNAYVSGVLSCLAPFDGELIVGSTVDPLVWNNTQSGVMSKDGEPDFVYHVFDRVDQPDVPFSERSASLKKLIDLAPTHVRKHVTLVPHYRVDNLTQFMSREEEFVGQGYEGIMIRSLTGPYKWGRSTEKEGSLTKLKRFFSAEAEIVGFKERMHNANVSVKNELGLSKRSTHKSGKVPMGTLGALICRAPISLFDESYPVHYGTSPEMVEFDIGSGLDDAVRQHIWDNQSEFLGEMCMFKYQEVTVNFAPLFGVYQGIRNKLDIV